MKKRKNIYKKKKSTTAEGKKLSACTSAELWASYWTTQSTAYLTWMCLCSQWELLDVLKVSKDSLHE